MGISRMMMEMGRPEISFMDLCNKTTRGRGFADQSVWAIKSNCGGGIRIEVLDFSGCTHLEDYLDQEASIDTYFE